MCYSVSYNRILEQSIVDLVSSDHDDPVLEL